MAEHPVIEVKNLQVDFLVEKEQLTAVRDVSFHVEEGKTLAIVGESGCGKSVTATSILRLLPARTSRVMNGEILFEGKDLLKVPMSELYSIRGHEISMVFQDPLTSLNPVTKIGKQLLEVLKLHQHLTKQESKERCIDMLTKVGIPEAAMTMDKYPFELSGGLQQRVMIAMALLGQPKLLIADEPTTALDVTIQRQILDLMKELQKEFRTAIILITHDMGVVAEMANDVAVMYAGEIVESDSAAGVFNHPLHPYTKGLLQSIPRFDHHVEYLPTIPGVVPGLMEMPNGCRFSNRCPFCKAACMEKPLELKAIGSTKMVRCIMCQEQEEGEENV